jgi:polysaccharide biosynthesis transport protein
MEANRTDENRFAAAPEAKLHFLDYWRIIRIRKTIILAVFLLVALTTTVVTYLLPKSYSSTVKLSIEQDVPDVDAKDRYLVRPTVDPFFIQTEFQRIQSKPVLYRVIEELNLQEEWGRKYKLPNPLTRDHAYRVLRGSINVEQSQNTTLVEIHAYSDKPEEAAKLANKVAEVYKEVRNETRTSITQGGVAALSKQLVEKEAAVSNQLQAVNKLRTDLAILDYETSAMHPTPRLDQETLRQINTALQDASRNFSIASNIYAHLANLPREKLKAAAPLQVPGDNRLGDLIAQENATEQQLAKLKNSQLGDEHSDVRSTTELLNTIRKQLDQALTGLIEGLRIRMNTERANMEGYQAQLAEMRQSDIADYTRTRPYYEAKEELTRRKMERDKLALSIDQAVTELNTPRVGAVQVIEPAEPNSIAIRPNKKLNIGLGIGVGLLIGIGLAFFIEYLDTSVKTIDDVERALQAPVLGVIPQNVGLLLEEGPDSPHAEAYRVLRTNVLFSRKDPKLNTLTVVSGGAGEGKSTTIFNLATVFAQNGQRVLVVDSDLRRPSLHKYLKLSNTIGLTNLLLKQNALEEVIQTTNQPGLDFMPSGRLPSSSMGILSSAQMKELIRDLKRRYDFVFFDSPPIMGVSDASILASEVDMVLQVIQYRRYPQPMTIRAKQMIEKVGGNLLGIVLNNINVSQDENYYYYSGYYYDYYQKGEYADEYTSRDKKGEKAPAANGAETAKVEIKSKF